MQPRQVSHRHCRRGAARILLARSESIESVSILKDSAFDDIAGQNSARGALIVTTRRPVPDLAALNLQRDRRSVGDKDTFALPANQYAYLLNERPVLDGKAPAHITPPTSAAYRISIATYRSAVRHASVSQPHPYCSVLHTPRYVFPSRRWTLRCITRLSRAISTQYGFIPVDVGGRSGRL